VQINNSETNSRQPTVSPRTRLELTTPIIGTSRVEIVQIETGNISITLNQTNQHMIIGQNNKKIVEPTAARE
jgi:hypothetical protein